jgi:hypothetical protein
LHTSSDEVKVPERVVRLMVQSRPKPVPPHEEIKPPRVTQQKPTETTHPAQVNKQAPEKAPEQPTETDQGILAFREKFAQLKDDQVVARLGSQAHIDNAADAATSNQRSMLTTNAPGSSGGINLASLSKSVGGGGAGLGRVQVARATSALTGISTPGGSHPLSNGAGPSRTDEEIQIVFDRYKAALYRLYNRELRKDPTLRGQMVLRLTIEPDGTVSMCQLQSSDMNAPDLAAQVVDRVKTINFGEKKDVPAITIVYPIDFLPAA